MGLVLLRSWSETFAQPVGLLWEPCQDAEARTPVRGEGFSSTLLSSGEAAAYDPEAWPSTTGREHILPPPEYRSARFRRT